MIRNSASQAKRSIHNDSARVGKSYETQSWVRNQRQGWRGLGLYQLSRFHSTEGVYTIGIGGPPVVGR